MCIVTVQLKSSFRFASYHPNWSEELQNFTESIGLRWEISLRNSSEKFSEKFHCFHRTSVAQLTKQLPSSTAQFLHRISLWFERIGKKLSTLWRKSCMHGLTPGFPVQGCREERAGGAICPRASLFNGPAAQIPNISIPLMPGMRPVYPESPTILATPT